MILMRSDRPDAAAVRTLVLHFSLTHLEFFFCRLLLRLFLIVRQGFLINYTLMTLW